MDKVEERVGEGKYFIEGVAVCCGNDINITIGGGEKYHIGSVGVAVPRNEIKNGKKRSSTASVICVQGHKEFDFAQYASKYLSTELNCVVTVSVGIHFDDAKWGDIEILENNFKMLIKKFEKSMSEIYRN
jgi:hypothetical protein